MPWSINELHFELAQFYRSYRGVTAPKNTYTESLWNKIEEIEAAARARRGK